MELVLNKVNADTKVKEAAMVPGAIRSTSEACTIGASQVCDNFLRSWRQGIVSLRAVDREITTKLSANGQDAEEQGQGQALSRAIQEASRSMRAIANELENAMPVIKNSEGISPIMSHTFDYCSEKLMPIKTSADRWFLIWGIGAFSSWLQDGFR